MKHQEERKIALDYREQLRIFLVLRLFLRTLSQKTWHIQYRNVVGKYVGTKRYILFQSREICCIDYSECFNGATGEPLAQVSNGSWGKIERAKAEPLTPNFPPIEVEHIVESTDERRPSVIPSVVHMLKKQSWLPPGPTYSKGA
jgi:hypothetical protein